MGRQYALFGDRSPRGRDLLGDAVRDLRIASNTVRYRSSLSRVFARSADVCCVGTPPLGRKAPGNAFKQQTYAPIQPKPRSWILVAVVLGRRLCLYGGVAAE